jgi:outer membrane protein OmpA-like peptidoglycan-associated protein
VVADALVARGAPRTALDVTTEGEDKPFVPTADGVREIQNRRVEIIPVR